MIIFIEGARGSGKTYLMQRYFEQNTDPRIKYYKFYFADWVKMLGLKGLDNDKALHYLSLGNILTILEQMKDNNNEILVFDRAIFSAYTWAILQRRLSKNVAIIELTQLVSSAFYQDCKLIYIDPPPKKVVDADREKDMWDRAHTFETERETMKELFDETLAQTSDHNKGNEFKEVYNDFTEHAVNLFANLMDSYLHAINT